MKYQSIIINAQSEISPSRVEELVKQEFKINILINELQTLTVTTEKNSIGISDLSNVLSWVSRKSNEIKSVLIPHAEKLTSEAQNSLLKIIEEPPENTIVILITKNIRSLLETIRSRCYQVGLSKEKQISNETYKNIAKEFLSISYLNKLKIVEKLLKDYDNREEIGEIVLEIIREYSQQNTNLDNLDTLKRIYIGIKKSVNLKLSLDLLCIITS